MIAFLIAMIVTGLAGTLVVQQYRPQTVLLLAGLVLFALTALCFPDQSILFKDTETTGWAGFDIFEFIDRILSYRLAGLGLIIMAAGGFAQYMDHIGATRAMVDIGTRPLMRLQAPYLVLALGYAVGQVLNIFIPSAAGLAMLLLVTLFPTLIRLGVSPAAAAAMIGTTSVLDLGPASGTANLAAHTADLDVALYFARYQVPASLFIVPVICVLTYLSARYFDRRHRPDAETRYGSSESLRFGLGAAVPEASPSGGVPAFYALLPILPLTLILIFSKLLIDRIQIGVVAAMIMGAVLGLVCEMVRRRREMRAVFDGFMVFFQGMGQMFSSIISLIVCAEFFAAGLKAIGAIDYLIDSAQGSGFGLLGMTLVTCLLVALTAILTGSGNAAFFSFAGLAPKVSAAAAAGPVALLLPLQFTAGIARSLSPVSGVVIAVAQAAGCSPMEIVKRTAIPLIGGLIVLFVYSALFVGVR